MGTSVCNLYWVKRQFNANYAYLDLSTPVFDAVEIYCFALVINSSTQRLPGLMLEKVEGVRGQYRRIGLFHVDDWHRDFVTNAKDTKFSEHEYVGVFKDGRVTITLI